MQDDIGFIEFGCLASAIDRSFRDVDRLLELRPENGIAQHRCREYCYQGDNTCDDEQLNGSYSLLPVGFFAKHVSSPLHSVVMGVMFRFLFFR